MFDRISPTNKAIILANVGVFLLQMVVPEYRQLTFALLPLQTGLFRPWQLLTYGFMHGNWLHIFFNMFAVFMFGSAVEQLFGARRYLIYYLMCIVGAAVMHLIVIYVARDLPLAPVVGASGGVFGLLLAFGMAYPRRELIIFPIPVPIQAWLAVTLYGDSLLAVAAAQAAAAALIDPRRRSQRQRAIGVERLSARPAHRVAPAFHFDLAFHAQSPPIRAARQRELGLPHFPR
jgi:membrane associated rhomboid family serine protease